MKTGKVCPKHPHLNGLRTNSHACAGCKREKDLARVKTIGLQRSREKARAYSDKLRNAVFNHYGMKCAICDFSNVDALTIDHINNDGAAHRREIKGSRAGGGMVTYRWLIKNKYPEGFRTLCQNCNIIEYKKFVRSKHM
jgi:hypothetical protein